jgi:hypothetical protein
MGFGGAEPSFKELNLKYELAKTLRTNKSHATKNRFYNIANAFELLTNEKMVSKFLFRVGIFRGIGHNVIKFPYKCLPYTLKLKYNLGIFENVKLENHNLLENFSLKHANLWMSTLNRL